MALRKAELVETIEALENDLMCGAENIYCICTNVGGWKLAAHVFYRAKNVHHNRAVEFMDGYITEAIVAYLKDEEMVEIGKFMSDICSRHHFSPGKAYKYKNDAGLTYYCKPDWEYWEE